MWKAWIYRDLWQHFRCVWLLLTRKITVKVWCPQFDGTMICIQETLTWRPFPYQWPCKCTPVVVLRPNHVDVIFVATPSQWSCQNLEKYVEYAPRASLDATKLAFAHPRWHSSKFAQTASPDKLTQSHHTSLRSIDGTNLHKHMVSTVLASDVIEGNTSVVASLWFLDEFHIWYW